jgi:hypothetical protein
MRENFAALICQRCGGWGTEREPSSYPRGKPYFPKCTCCKKKFFQRCRDAQWIDVGAPWTFAAIQRVVTYPQFARNLKEFRNPRPDHIFALLKKHEPLGRRLNPPQMRVLTNAVHLLTRPNTFADELMDAVGKPLTDAMAQFIGWWAANRQPRNKRLKPGGTGAYQGGQDEPGACRPGV